MSCAPLLERYNKSGNMTDYNAYMQCQQSMQRQQRAQQAQQAKEQLYAQGASTAASYASGAGWQSLISASQRAPVPTDSFQLPTISVNTGASGTLILLVTLAGILGFLGFFFMLMRNRI